ncbi:MAG: PaaI family thioesterase [Proteobacteria bacterium]|nr:PaaI family thioesterase [Pseudomonadota bacterium]MBS0571696.1 PaaI family thioesterase [Pseudomonadota bacterium]
MRPILTEAELSRFLAETFPQVRDDFSVERLTPDGIVLRLKVGERHLRPGGTVSGPTLFGLADVAFYFALMSRIGLEALAVTTNVAMDFLRKPMPDADLLGEARILKIGRHLAAGDVLIRSEGQEEVVARAGLTFSIPPQKPAVAVG